LKSSYCVFRFIFPSVHSRFHIFRSVTFTWIPVLLFLNLAPSTVENFLYALAKVATMG